MLGAWAGAMEAVFFSAKRAHHAGLKFCRDLLAGSGLTPARFDLLYALANTGAKTQMALRKALGVARATISEMLEALEMVGLVRREPDAQDRRTLRVALTDKGRAAVSHAYEKCVASGAATIAVDCAFGAHDNDQLRYQFEEACTCLRKAFHDEALDPLYEWEGWDVCLDTDEVEVLYLVDFVRCQPDAIRSWFRGSARCS